MGATRFREPQYYINRELSWLEFNQRVLDEAREPKNPLLERAKFLAITLSNLDEFFMVRVASIKDQIQAGYEKTDPAGLTPKQQMKRISERSHEMLAEAYSIYSRILLPQLKREGFRLLSRKALTRGDRQYLQELFETELYPVLTPMAVDPSRPFPLILNKSLNIALFLEEAPEEEEKRFATVQVPSVLPRLINLPEEGAYVLLEDVIILFMEQLFPNQKIKNSACYRITRSGDLNFQEEETHNLLKEMEQSLKQRRRGQAVRLEMTRGADEELTAYLMKALELQSKDLYLHDGPMDIGFISRVGKLMPLEQLKKPDLIPQPPADLLGVTDLFAAIRERDILMHHPYESFQPVVNFMQQAAEDPNVLAIKQTLYRVSGNSPVVQALARAAENGKQVTVLVEVKARFDEENNIQWAKKLEKAGCHVIYGLLGLKTHCKVTIVVRRDEDRIRRYVHMSTGNYNDVTARLYTDIGYFTAKEPFGADASALFNSLTGYGDPPAFRKVAAAPLGLRRKFTALIEREARNASQGREARIVAKMNSLLDPDIIESLYQASAAGVHIDLIVRGICALRPGIAGISENIRVRSVVGWLLEHSRIFYFYNDGHEEYYLSSADWMTRNLDRRVELLFPIEEERLMKRLGRILDTLLADTQKARQMDRDGNYIKVDGRGKPAVNCQETFYQEAVSSAREYDGTEISKIFCPLSSPETEEEAYMDQEE